MSGRAQLNGTGGTSVSGDTIGCDFGKLNTMGIARSMGTGGKSESGNTYGTINHGDTTVDYVQGFMMTCQGGVSSSGNSYGFYNYGAITETGSGTLVMIGAQTMEKAMACIMKVQKPLQICIVQRFKA